MAFWLHFQVLGVWLEAPGAILGHLGEKLGYLGRSWRQVGTLLAACWDKDGMSQDKRTWEQNGWLKATRYGEGWWVFVAFERASASA